MEKEREELESGWRSWDEVPLLMKDRLNRRISDFGGLM